MNEEAKQVLKWILLGSVSGILVSLVSVGILVLLPRIGFDLDYYAFVSHIGYEKYIAMECIFMLLLAIISGILYGIIGGVFGRVAKGVKAGYIGAVIGGIVFPLAIRLYLIYNQCFEMNYCS